jgi:hypothetical protein
LSGAGNLRVVVEVIARFQQVGVTTVTPGLG